ncbi:hypothetical protein GpartN1_g4509.t1 [Galdieria partita]|uniref:Fungal lipase-type domain-containing protein n=1 Tax=Galdieria partita TaxID=83374 RepID=A0A9C7PXH6_9RHOD|nr:hypothetical protein GpartN1_g4509.t1 [Galdieria partita]
MFLHLTKILFPFQVYTSLGYKAHCRQCLHRKPTFERNSFTPPHRVSKAFILCDLNQPSSLEQTDSQRNEVGNDTFAKIQKYFEEASQRLGFSQEDMKTLSQSLLSTLGIQKSATPVILRHPKKEQFQLRCMLILAGYAFESYNEPLPLYCEETTENCFVAFASKRLVECFGSGFLVVKVKELNGFRLSKVKGLRLCMDSRVAKFQNLLSEMSTLHEKRKLSNLFQVSSSSGEFSLDNILFGCILVHSASEPQKDQHLETLPGLLMQFCYDELATKESVWAQVSISHVEGLNDLKQTYTLAIRTIAFVGIPFLLRRLLFQILRLLLQYIPKWKGHQDRPFYLLKEYIQPRVIGVAKVEISYWQWNNRMSSSSSYPNNVLCWETIQKYQRHYLMANEAQRKANFRKEESIKWKELTERWQGSSSSTMECFDKTELLCMIENIETDTELLIWQQTDSTIPILYIAFRGTEQHSWQDFFTDALVYQQSYFFGDDDIDIDLHINPFKDAISSKGPKSDSYFQFHQTEMEWKQRQRHNGMEDSSKEEEIHSYIEQQLACPFEGPKVHYGFLRSFAGIRETFLQVIEKAVGSEYLKDDVKATPILYFTGHSLGGALATLAAGEVAYRHPSWQIQMYNFGSPRVGNAEFVNIYNQLVPHSFRVVNDTDIIARIPRSQNFEYYHVGNTVLINQQGELWTQGQSGEEDPLDDNWSSLQEMLEAEWSLLNSLSKGMSLEHHLEAAYLVAMESLLKRSSE